MKRTREGLKEMGYDEGRSVAIEYRFAENQYDRLPALAADLVRQQVTLIFANGISVPPAMAATAVIPIVFTTGGDPVRLGFVASLDRPGGNATGVTTANIGNAVPRLAMLRELVPGAGTIGFLQNPDSPLTNLHDVQAAACGQFSTVLAPGSNAFHYDHVHVDLARHGSGRAICNPAAIPARINHIAGARWPTNWPSTNATAVKFACHVSGSLPVEFRRLISSSESVPARPGGR